MGTRCESDPSAKMRCMRPQGSNIATGYGSKTAGVIFRGCAYDRVGRGHAVSVGEMIDSSRPQSNELTTLYVVDISEGNYKLRDCANHDFRQRGRDAKPDRQQCREQRET